MGEARSIGQVANYKPLAKCGMEELAARQMNIEPSGGVLFARNSDGEEKRAARNLVRDLFRTNRWDGPLNMLTMPGVGWKFERELLDLREPGWRKRPWPYKTHFTAVENDRAIYFAGVAQMIGTETPNRLIKPVKRERFPFAELAVKSRFASFFFANVDDMLAHDWVRPAYREEKQGGWDAAWLDYTGPLSRERLAKIQRFYERFIKSTLVVTVLKARWDKPTVTAMGKAGGHSRWLGQSLPGEVLHDIEYFDTSPMAQFAVRK